MFHSIRWRIVASYALLTLLTVTLLGLLVLSLMQRYMERQEQAFLRANAEAVARQSELFMLPAVKPPVLHQLAQTAAFLGDVQVKILDDQKRILVDSGEPATLDKVALVVGMEQGAVASTLTVSTQAPPPIFFFRTMPNSSEAAPAKPLIEQAEQAVFISKSPSVWGARLNFAPSEIVTAPVQSMTTFMSKEILPTPFVVEMPRSSNVVVEPIRTGDTVLGYVELSSGPNFAAEALGTMRQVFLLAGLGVALLAIVLGLVVSQGLTAPLQGLAAATSRMNSGDLSARAPIYSHDEIGLLAHGFNQMAAALENSFRALAAERDALRRFIADASHELRTPITALQTFNELLQGEAVDDPTTQQEFLQESAAQINRLTQITSGLLNLSRLDSGLVELGVTEQDLVEVVTVVAAPFQRLAIERGIDFQVEPASAALPVRCDRTQIEVALTNLLDNALKFTPSGGQVRVCIAARAEWMQIEVNDTGPGIDLADLPRLFERFYRGRNAATTGSGLGLAIVHRIMEMHNGAVEVVSKLGQGSCFILKLPR